MQQNTKVIESMFHGPEIRKFWMGTLAKSKTKQLRQALLESGLSPEYEYLRSPEVGMTMVRGRAEGNGEQFNLGEMTVTRCSIKTASGFIGHGYVAGRDKVQAELVAIFDALLQSPEHGPSLLKSVIEPLNNDQKRNRQKQATKTAATKVNFFTMVRGED